MKFLEFGTCNPGDGIFSHAYVRVDHVVAIEKGTYEESHRDHRAVLVLHGDVRIQASMFYRQACRTIVESMRDGVGEYYAMEGNRVVPVEQETNPDPQPPKKGDGHWGNLAYWVNVHGSGKIHGMHDPLWAYVMANSVTALAWYRVPQHGHICGWSQALGCARFTTVDAARKALELQPPATPTEESKYAQEAESMRKANRPGNAEP